MHRRDEPRRLTLDLFFTCDLEYWSLARTLTPISSSLLAQRDVLPVPIDREDFGLRILRWPPWVSARPVEPDRYKGAPYVERDRISPITNIE